MTTDLTSGDGNGISDVTSPIAADSANSDSDVSGTQGGTQDGTQGGTQGGPKREEVIQIIVTEATTTDNGTDSDGS